jgi:hypothetical protein
MGGTKLDGAGTAKMQTIESALSTLRTINSQVERMAIDVKNNRGCGVTPGQIKRTATPMQGLLKGQFGVIADQVTAMILNVTRGGPDLQRVRLGREGVAQLRTALEMAASKVKAQHAVDIEVSGD